MKKYYTSRTFWVGVTAIIAGFGMFATGEQTVAEFLLGANGVLAIVLRFLTDSAITK